METIAPSQEVKWASSKACRAKNLQVSGFISLTAAAQSPRLTSMTMEFEGKNGANAIVVKSALNAVTIKSLAKRLSRIFFHGLSPSRAFDTWQFNERRRRVLICHHFDISARATSLSFCDRLIEFAAVE